MTEMRNHALRTWPVTNYKSALARAVEWLGDRYLLARPINLRRSPSYRRLE
jgi:hypothetical protein